MTNLKKVITDTEEEVQKIKERIMGYSLSDEIRAEIRETPDYRRWLANRPKNTKPKTGTDFEEEDYFIYYIIKRAL